MRADEYSLCDATELARLIAMGEVSTLEVNLAALKAIECINPVINALAEVYLDRIDSPAGKTSGPLGGVPFLLKDTGATEAGLGQTCGSRLGQGYISSVDSNLTKRYRDAGLNIIGRSLMPEFAVAATTESEQFGVTRNPWHLAHSAGGSSGGAAAAVAAGMVPIAHGTDTGGSIRIPAACCGLVGLKPSRGLISKGPQVDEALYAGINTEHVITRSVRDTALILQLSQGHEMADLFYSGIEGVLSPHLTRPLKIGYSTKGGNGISVEAELREAVLQVANQLATMGHELEECDLQYDYDAWARADDVVWRYSTSHEARRLAEATGRVVDEALLEPPIYEACLGAGSITLDDWFEAMTIYYGVRRDVAEYFGSFDVYLSPTIASTPPVIGYLASNQDISYEEFMERTGEFCPFTSIFNVAGFPAISLPLCTGTDGQPIGIQLATPTGTDQLLLELSFLLEEAMPWSSRFPSTHVSQVNL